MKYIYLLSVPLIHLEFTQNTSPSQITIRFGFFRYITFAMYLDMHTRPLQKLCIQKSQNK
jgi:hypothetical protein